MKYKYPHYYKQFRCIAGACEATCCAGWEIVIDEESLEKYVNLKSDFGNRLCNSIDFEEGIFYQDHKKRCAFLNEENLCDIYSEVGEDHLCYTCTQYPRHIEEFEDVNEVSLSISCPEVAEMLLSCEEKISFYEEEVEEEVEEFEDFDFLFYEILYDVREAVFEVLQNRNLTMNQRMQLTWDMSHEIQEKINAYETFAIDELVQGYREKQNLEVIECIGEEEAYRRVQVYFTNLYRLEALQETWPSYLYECQTRLYEIPFEEYGKWKSEFTERYKDELERMKEQFMVYFIYSYFCGAVYDGEVLAKYQLAHVTTCIIEELWLAQYIKNSGTISKEEMRRITYQYAREIEHSDQNLDMLEEIYAYPLF